MALPEATLRINAIARQYRDLMVADMKGNIRSMDIRDSGQLLASVRGKVGYKFGEAEKVAFGLKRHGIYREKGAGRGKGGTKGSTWYTAKGEKRSTNPGSLGKMDTGKRKAKPWFNPVIDEYLEPFADEIAAAYGDAALNAIKI